jgi:DNA-directed RNA polymerase specialized sigma24 family protein
VFVNVGGLCEAVRMNVAIEDDVLAQFEPHRRELCAYAYRMLGSSFEAEDAVQDAFTRAWKSYGSFEGRASLRSWLYKITTNVCLDMIKGPQRRARPMDLAPASCGSSRSPTRWRSGPTRRRPPRPRTRCGSRSSRPCSTCPPSSAR